MAHLLPSGATEPCQRLRIPAATGKAESCIVGEPTDINVERGGPFCRAWPKVEIGSDGEPALHEAVKPELGAARQAIRGASRSVAKTDAVRNVADRTTLSRLLWQRLEQLVRVNYTPARTSAAAPNVGARPTRVPSGSPGQCLAVHAGEVQTARAGLPPSDSNNERPEAPQRRLRANVMFARECKEW